ncbi:hypothetical protein IAE16_02175 [Hydrogenobacter sp. T-2]|nr:hypothetical protein [Hydrogenobacter sp. T-2]WPM32494.1 hypothetical protein IAE16_02175 [Hydrogenobacter sp. T-2]
MCCFSKEELEKMKAMAKERKKIRESLKNIKPSDFEKKEEKTEVFVSK